MNLVQKLPIGLSLACLMFMSSCSKEEAVTPGSAATNESSNLREGGPVLSTYHFPSTDGPTCLGCAPSKWTLKNPARGATSNLTLYAGSPFTKWTQPLSTPSTGSGSIITVVGDENSAGVASADVENLIKGKKYKFTFSISTTKLNGAVGPNPYAHNANIWIADNATTSYANASFAINYDKKNQWITKTVEFEAKAEKQTIIFASFNKYEEAGLAYSNIHVGQNAVQPVN